MGLEQGATFGQYEVVSPLGAGAMGIVWRAIDTQLGREVALKVLPDDIAPGSDRHARFEREAKVLASLNHPNLATLYGVEHMDTDQGVSHVLVMELVEGEGLDERIARGALPLDEAAAIALQVAAGLGAAHDHGIVHRDLKPANVRLRPDGVAKVLDFGLAKVWHDGDPSQEASSSPTVSMHRSLVGAVIGTTAYMAPEQARGRAVDHRTDIWAFGCLLFEMLTGRSAFDGDTVSDVIADILKDEPRWALLPAGLDPVMHRIMRRCLAKDPQQRYHHLGDIRLELLDTLNGETDITPVVSGEQSRRRRVLPLALAGLALVLLATVLLVALRRPPPRQLPTFRPLTFRSSHVSSARFAHDDQTVIFGMATSDHPLSLYSTRVGSIESRRLDLPDADVLGIASDDRMLIILGRHREGTWVSVGTLAEADLAGGAPRPLLERANDGAIAPDGSAIAVVHEVGPVEQLEYPLGHVLFTTHGWISHVSISPDGRQVAFLHHPFYGDDRGLPMLVRPGEEPVALAPRSPNSLQGLAWSPDGTAVWYTEYVFGEGGVIWSARPGKAPVALLRSPVSMRLQDVAQDGRTLLIASDTRAEIIGRLAGHDTERRYEGWNDDSIDAISADGQMFAGNQQQRSVDGEYSAFVRSADGSPPVIVGQGHVLGMTANGRWVFLQRMTRDRNRVTIIPTQAGSPCTIDLGDVVPVTTVISLLTSSLDSRRVAFIGEAGDGGLRAYVLDLEFLTDDPTETRAGGIVPVEARPIGPVGVTGAILSPDGTRIAARAADGVVSIFPVDGSAPTPVPGLAPGEVPLQWTRDGRSLLVWNRVFPAAIDRVAISDGHRDRQRDIMPDNPAGVLYGQIILAPGGEYYIYRIRRDLNTLFAAEGIR